MFVARVRTASDLECENGSEIRLTELLEQPLEPETSLKNCWEIRRRDRAGKGLTCQHGCVAWYLEDVRRLLVSAFGSHMAGGTYYFVRQAIRPGLTGHTSTLIRAQCKIQVEAVALVLDGLQCLFEQLIESRVSKAIDGPVRGWLNGAVRHGNKLCVHKAIEIEGQELYAASADISQGGYVLGYDFR